MTRTYVQWALMVTSCTDQFCDITAVHTTVTKLIVFTRGIYKLRGHNPMPDPN